MAQKDKKQENTAELTPAQIAEQKIEELLSKYEEGRDVFIKAHDWTYPVHIKDEFKDDLSLPQSWVQLADKVFSILAHDKYGLDTYDNTIEIIDADQMLEAYTKVGLPVMYDHWSFGKQRVQLDKAYEGGQMGLAYEIIINTAPAIAYCMEQNTKTTQMLVIAHASYGHNTFFKNNHMFRQFTKADEIIPDMRRLKNKVQEAENKYGRDRVEKLLDACHALETHSVDKYTKPKRLTEEEIKERQRVRQETERRNYKADIEDTRLRNAKKDFDSANDDKKQQSVHPEDREENLLMYMVENAPHLERWEREIMELMAVKAQYFYPQRQTQMMNEGCASDFHYKLMNDLSEMGLIDDGMMIEFLKLHAGVIFQPKRKLVQDPQTGEITDQPGLFDINVYALGFAMYQDIERICENPTQEDYEWFPEIAGNNDWLGTIKHAIENFKDESFVLQYLSPKVIRDFQFFDLDLDEEKPYYEVSAIHSERGYKKIRETLASNYRLSDKMPSIFVDHYDFKGDRSLTLKYIPYDNKPLEEDDMQQVLKHMYRLWQHPVRLKIMDEEGNLDSLLGCPEPTNSEYQELLEPAGNTVRHFP